LTLSAIIPTLGASPLLVPCLEALRREGAEIIVVDQGPTPVAIPAGLADRILRPGRNLGFAAGTNAGIAEATGEWIATVNDDAIVEPGWAAALVAALEADPKAAAAQGVNLVLDRPEIADGCGIAWNRWWQAVQVGHGKPAPGPEDGAREIFGVSATAAVYRRAALPEGDVFDPRLVSYYEDVDLAVRLRATGWRALLVPAARALHTGSLTGRTLSRERWRLIYGNRWRVAARHLGGGFWPRAPFLAVRDGVDLGRALLRGDGELAAGIVSGWGRALRPR
jgi:N-acetylglucosaminyl-diphospho-decaprenol L-rhamnosyltransferase